MSDAFDRFRCRSGFTAPRDHTAEATAGDADPEKARDAARAPKAPGRRVDHAVIAPEAAERIPRRGG